MKMDSRNILGIPNYITMGRMAAVPFVAILLMLIDDSKGPTLANKIISFATAFVFASAMLSDMLDGWYARRYNITSTIGKFLDPLADKLLFVSAMIMMIPLERVPAWLVVMFMVREVGITALRAVAASKGIVISASHWGKYKSAFVSCATVAFILHYKLFGVEWRIVAWVLVWPALAFSIMSGVHYTSRFLKQTKWVEDDTTSA